MPITNYVGIIKYSRTYVIVGINKKNYGFQIFVLLINHIKTGFC